MEEFIVDLALENVEEKDNRFLFTARSITKDFTCDKGLERLANDSPGKPVVWRHEHPLIPKFKSTHIYGRVLESQVDGKDIVSKYEIYDHTEEHRKVRKVIKDRYDIGEPSKISMRFRQYGDDDNPIHFDVIEHSLTPTPACEECKVIDILNESDNMPNEKEEKLKEILELEKQLTKKDKLLEELNAKIVTLEKDIKESIKSAEDSAKELEEAKSSSKEVTEQLLEFKDKLGEQDKIIDQLKEDLKYKEIEPLINQLVELDGEEMKGLYIALSKEEGGKDKLLERIEKLEEKSNVHAVTKDLGESAGDAQFKDEELEDDEIKSKRDKQAFSRMPEEFFEKRGAK